MEHNYVLSLADPLSTLERVGGKGMSLARLARAGLPAPGGFSVTTEAYCRFVSENSLQPAVLAALREVRVTEPATLDSAAQTIGQLFARARIPDEIADAITRAYASLGGGEPAVAVRSSATAEDLPGLSFAGQQETFLNIRGEAVLDAVKRCWASLWTARAIGYRTQHGIDQDSVSLAVVVQLLIPAQAAGILFTADPVTGQRERVLINAAWGLGEAIVSGQVTPDSLAVDRSTGRVLERETADKQVMTVRVTGGTQEEGVPQDLRRAPVLDDTQAAELARLGAQIETLYGMPMDIEWALADKSFAIVQARPITALPEPQPPAPVEWKLPNPKGQYMRGSIIDLLPDPLSPLFATLGLPAVRDGMYQAYRAITGSEPVLADDYVTTINGYAYMDGYLPPRALWWIVTGMLPAMPRMIRKGLAFWRDEARPRYAAVLARWEARPLGGLSAMELWRGAEEVAAAATEHLGALMVGTMGASAASEGTFTQIYNRLIRREGDPDAAAFLLGYDSTPIQAEKSLYDLAAWCRERPALADLILSTPSGDLAARMANGQPSAGASSEDWQEFGRRFREHQRKFGHIIYTLDWAHPLPLDTPAPVLETCKMYLRGEGTNPHERQRAAQDRRVLSTQAILERVRGLRRWAFEKSVGWAQSLAEVREAAIADIGLGYPVLRRLLFELGQRLAQAEAIAQAEDIMWLERGEIDQAVAALERGQPPAAAFEQVAQRKAACQAARRVTPPPMLPPRKKYMGVDVSAWVAAGEDSHTGDTLKGVATSGGLVTAPACVLHGPEDFGRMKPGAVLVAATTTPAWTPLFAMASAVVTDIGGPLSHGSIVAREYGIPAVMGAGVATRRIRDGQMVTVDGGAGTVVCK